MYLNDLYTIPANLAGIPAISVPCGVIRQEFPIGLHMMTERFPRRNCFLNRACVSERKESDANLKPLSVWKFTAQLATDSKIFCGCRARLAGKISRRRRGEFVDLPRLHGPTGIASGSE